MKSLPTYFTFCIVGVWLVKAGYANVYMDLLNLSMQMTEERIQQLRVRWEIDKYPNFLRSLAMPHTSWEHLKYKFQKVILESLMDKNKKSKFVISFMGSSVTSGHDSPFNQSFPIKIREMMQPSFDALHINLITRNVAIGNNPCLVSKIELR